MGAPGAARERTKSFPVQRSHTPVVPRVESFKPYASQSVQNVPIVKVANTLKSDTNDLLDSIGDKWESKRKALFTRARQELEAKRKARLSEAVVH